MILKFTALIVLLGLCVSCRNSAEQMPDRIRANKSHTEQLDRKIADFTPTEKEEYHADSITLPQSDPPQHTNDQLPAKIDWDKKIVKTAQINAEVKHYKTFSRQLGEKVKSLGGYISNEQQSQTAYKIENTVVIKIPVDQFDPAITSLVAGAEKLNEKRISSEDVTTELVDGKSRLEAKKQVRLRYLDLLKQARNMEEILNVQNEINGIQEEIEMVSGRINFLQHSSAMSTIHFTFYQVINPAAIAVPADGFAAKLKTAFNNGWSWIKEIAVGLISVWPLILVICLVFVWLRRRGGLKAKTTP